MTGPERNARTVFWMLAGGFAWWGAVFVALYALLSVGCAYGWDARPFAGTSLQRAVLVGAWLASLVPLAAMLLLQYRLWTARTASTLMTIGAVLTALALAATVWNFGMVTFLSTCR
ncbi:hypothetical protein LUX29_10235 [Aureimonas altamirensis]|uniref:hypothetical protein n=1 Tax=Aureimonas altamirensis TaxID=370622 RepID=UPI001E3002CD|nr:hypothetical protein [Aureimonas altamirensis]UHD47508.1 hypothetical protein LUX29_10235 [Aureimonas altamirensis]